MLAHPDRQQQQLLAAGPGVPSDLAGLLEVAFPSPQLAAAAISWWGTPHDGIRAGRHGLWRDGKDFLLSCSGGTVGLRLVDSDRRERTLATHRRRKEASAVLVDPDRRAVEAAEALGLIDLPEQLRADPRGGFELEAPLVRNARGEWVPAKASALRSRVITEWSRKSRREMTRCLSELDYKPVFSDGRLPAMLTLTYPGEWEKVAPSGQVVKGHLRALQRRWEITYGHRPAGLWKMEFQRRGAPHFHIFAVPELTTPDGMQFRTWLSETWADIVASSWCGARCWDRDDQGDRQPCCERGRHVLAGTGIDYRDGARMRDPKRLAVYFLKHGGAAGGKEYQHLVPLQWRTAETGPGRFWGRWGLDRHRAETYLDLQDYLQLRRTLRRYSRSQGLTRRRRVLRGVTVDERTGELREAWRTVTRRTVLLSQGGLVGGWIAVNDGPEFVRTLSKNRSPGEGRGFAAALRAWGDLDARAAHQEV